MPFLQIIGLAFKWLKSKPILLMVFILFLLGTNAKTLWDLDTVEDELAETTKKLNICEKTLAECVDKVEDQNSSIEQWQKAGQAAAQFAKEQDRKAKERETYWRTRIKLLEAQSAPTEATQALDWLVEKFQGVQ